METYLYNYNYNDLFNFRSRGPKLWSEILGNHLDIQESDAEYSFAVEVPGVKQKDINISLEKDILSVVAKNDKYNYEKSFRLSEKVDLEKVGASLEDGVLTIHLPKKAQVQPKRIEIKVS